jgi:uncharacterized protein (TIGR00251 family)
MAAFSHVRVVIMPSKLWVTVKPQSKKSEVKKISAGEYAVSVNAPAREGKANEAVIELLADYFSIPKSTIRIVRGQTVRRKLIEIG